MSIFFRAHRIGIFIRRLSVQNGKRLKCQQLQEFPNLKLGSRFWTQKRFSSRSEMSTINPVIRKYFDHVVSEYDKINRGYNTSMKIEELRPLAGLLSERLKIIENLTSLDELVEQDSEMKKLAEEERSVYKKRLEELDEELLAAMLSDAGKVDCNDIVLEITAGVGGQEAMLFARELCEMYLRYVNHLGFQYNISTHDVTEIGGTRQATILVSGAKAFEIFRHEVGVHRVQRVPATEKSGRVHTSTVSIVVLPQPTEIQVVLKDKDLKIETKRSSGAGGQNVNVTDSAVRIVHLPTGIAVECQTERSQARNKQTAMTTLRAKIYEQQENNQQAATFEMRKNQKGMASRNEKIRTYNYNQDRITDHRLTNGTFHDLKGFLRGGEALEDLHQSLQLDTQRRILLETIENVQSGS